MTHLNAVIQKLTEVELQLNRCLARDPHENEKINEALIALTKIRIILEAISLSNKGVTGAS